MRSLLTLAMLLVAVAPFTLAPPGAPHASAATTNVSVEDNKYVPPSVTINVGDTVHWTWAGVNPHTVTATDMSYDSGGSKTSGTFDHTFNAAGTFTYFCQVHGAQVMSGTVVVQQAAAAPTSTAQPAPIATSAPASTNTAAAAANATPAAATPPRASTSAVAATTIAAAPGTTASGGAAGASAAGAPLPRAGTGSAGSGVAIGYLLPLMLAIAGAGSIALAFAVRRR